MTKKQTTAALTLLTMCTLLLTGCTTQPTTSTDTNSEADVESLSVNNSFMDEAKIDKYSQAPAVLSAEELANKVAVMKTDKGEIEIELYGVDAPQTVSNFIFLANEKFYDGLFFHRVESGFVAQGGDPAGDGTGGPGYDVPAEIGRLHEEGAIATARLSDFVNPDKKSSGSQFYFALKALPMLDGEYTVFGKITKGLEVMKKLEVGDQIISVEIK